MDKETFKLEANKRIDDISEKIDILTAKKDAAVAEWKEEYNDKLIMLKEKKAVVKQRFDELEGASEEKWEEVKAGFSAASESFKEGFSKLTALFK